MQYVGFVILRSGSLLLRNYHELFALPMCLQLSTPTEWLWLPGESSGLGRMMAHRNDAPTRTAEMGKNYN
jgi:hypothetical protein